MQDQTKKDKNTVNNKIYSPNHSNDFNKKIKTQLKGQPPKKNKLSQGSTNIKITNSNEIRKPKERSSINMKFPFKVMRRVKSRRKKVYSESKRVKNLSFELIKFLYKNNGTDMSLDNISSKLGVEKRKIYDLINIFSSFHLIRKVRKGNYVWNGISQMDKKLNEVLGSKEDRPNFKNFQMNKEVKEKSLGVLTFSFMKLLKANHKLNIEKAAEFLTPRHESNKYKTKVRRLYDISRVLASLGILTQAQDGKKSPLEWVGLEKAKAVILNSLREIDPNKNIIKKNNYYIKNNIGTSFMLLIDMMSKENSETKLELTKSQLLGKRTKTNKNENSDNCQLQLAFPIAHFPKSQERSKILKID